MHKSHAFLAYTPPIQSSTYQRWRLPLWMMLSHPRTLVRHKECFTAWHFQHKWPGTSWTQENIQKHHAVAPNFSDFGCHVTLEPLNGKVCSSLIFKATQELLNGGWIIYGNQSKQTKCAIFLRKAILWALVNSMHKTVHRGAHGHLQVFVWSPRSERWPR